MNAHDRTTLRRMREFFEAETPGVVYVGGLTPEAALLALKAVEEGLDIDAKTNRVTRVKLIDEQGHRYLRWPAAVTLSFQDDGRTLKVFVGPLPSQPEHRCGVERDAAPEDVQDAIWAAHVAGEERYLKDGQK